jgi:hypothetical protein
VDTSLIGDGCELVARLSACHSCTRHGTRPLISYSRIPCRLYYKKPASPYRLRYTYTDRDRDRDRDRDTRSATASGSARHPAASADEEPRGAKWGAVAGGAMRMDLPQRTLLAKQNLLDRRPFQSGLADASLSRRRQLEPPRR